mmetsp:Transcript_87227/g.249911  ORF Transcript_87227/g.249911 Transcript_87227/m.249911 type:complete len:237 (-) Transcript_87227:129-839(-)
MGRGGRATKARAGRGAVQQEWQGKDESSQDHAAFWQGWEVANSPNDSAATTESVLDALAPGTDGGVEVACYPQMKVRDTQHASMWLVAEPRDLSETYEGALGPENLMGHWVDSGGNAVHVMSTDAYDAKLVATLRKLPRPDIFLSVKPVALGGGWQCGHSLLDPEWTTQDELHWVAMDGRVSVWVRPHQEPKADDDDKASGKSGSLGDGHELRTTRSTTIDSTLTAGGGSSKADAA